MAMPRRARDGSGVSLAVLVATAVLAGCGGGSSSTGSSASSTAAATGGSTSTASTAAQPSAKGAAGAEFVASAGAICTRVETEITAAKPKSASVAEILRIVPGRATSEQNGATELSALKPPPALARDWRLVVAYRRTLARELTALARAAQKKDTAKIKALSASKLREHRLLLAMAKRAGVKVCGTVG